MLACHRIDIAPASCCTFHTKLWGLGRGHTNAQAWQKIYKGDAAPVTHQSVFQSLSGLEHVPLMLYFLPLLEV